ncbi:uncharacterized protein MAM_03129 [Metarhizium album ARSEF 1941]|uniref:Integral membrane protein n=1 Tax=Metarhizium album (strain ARSEF 1941) TaxID=1081103 RepID=A0A0B2WTM5_METAS|nr:uncharacterized protein MAM_03129 [Metarhizium album ARSEF 1941]KHN99431.1 integral membrane protein [Metarhizium album ARSEF 1941]
MKLRRLVPFTATVLAACNGHSELCGKKYSEVTFVGSHDSAFVGRSLAHNQYVSVTKQLNLGVRFLQAQTHDKLGTIEMCHTFCWELDSGTLRKYLQEIADWMHGNPNEVVTLLLTNKDAIPVRQFDAVFQSTGLSQYAFHPQGVLSKDRWPTLQQLLDAETRLVVFMDYHSDQSKVDYIIGQFDYFWETPYGITDKNFPTCSVDRPRGGDPKTLLGIMNHMLNFKIGDIVVPDQINTKRTNSVGSILQQVDLCESQGKPQPNVILLDHINIGEAQQAQLKLNAFAPATRAQDANPPGQSTFISKGNNVAFAFTVPHDDDNPRGTFFSIRVPRKYTWGGVGLGSDDMKGALFLIIYENGDGTNVTFSPRVAHGNYEPAFFHDMRWTVIPNNTGIIDDYMVFSAMCTESCRTWPSGDTSGGYIDVSSPTQKAIYAVGPQGVLRDDSPSAGLKFHQEHGVFSIDMGRTRGAADAPVLNKDSKSEGTEQISRATNQKDLKAGFHAALMVFSILGVIGIGGVVLLPTFGWAKWHPLNQIVATVGVLAGLAIGILASFHYQRSRSFRHPHQILGYTIIALIIAQLGLGVKHHIKHRRTKASTVFGKIHGWMGKLILLAAFVNGIIGFTFALNPTSAITFGALVILVTATLIFLRLRVLKKSQKFQPVSTQQQPVWRADSGYNAGYSSGPPPGYEQPPQQVGLQAIGSPSNNSPWSTGDKDREDEPQLGSAQRPREFA